ncbi:MAG: hypothetical protein EHM70_23070 [Chloroflexota bacterium]|nr:MAG: hypothetical protein EHM70_23070 [Chloroflexota bacterium]
MGEGEDSIQAGAGQGRRKRGGQPGNANALKHGFYSRRFKSGEVQDLETANPNGLKDEIAMLRVATRRVMDLADGLDTLDEAIVVLRALGLAASRLAGLLKTQKALSGPAGDGANQAISDALGEIARELGILKESS